MVVLKALDLVFDEKGRVGQVIIPEWGAGTEGFEGMCLVKFGEHIVSELCNRNKLTLIDPAFHKLLTDVYKLE